MNVQEMIKKINGEYFVYSEDGSKKLGGPYKSRKEAVHRLQQVEYFKHKESLIWEASDLKFEEVTEENANWLKVSGTALNVGKSRNNRVYSYKNLKENDGQMFNFIVGHRDDYDNPEHNVGEGIYKLMENTLEFGGKIKNTTKYPDIVEKVKSGLIGPSVHGGANITKKVSESGQIEYILEDLKIPLIALVNKHTRGVSEASIEAAVSEKMELEESEDVEKEKDVKEAVKMAEDNVLEVELKKKEQEITELKKQLEMKEKETIVNSIMEVNIELKKETLMEKDMASLKLVLEYEKLLVDAKKKSVSEVADNNNVSEKKDTFEGIVIEEKSGYISMNDTLYKKFNEDIKKSIYR